MRLLLPLLLTACIQQPDIYRPEDAPRAMILEPGDGTAVQAGEVALRGRASDGQDAPEHLFALWQLGGAEAEGWEQACAGFVQADGSTLCLAALRADHVAVRLRVIDLAGFEGLDEVGVVVIDGYPPAIDVLAPDAGPWFSNVPIPFDLQITEVDDPVVSVVVQVISDLQGVLALSGTPDPTGRLRGESLLEEGVHRVEVAATDPGGRVARVVQQVVVGGPDLAPVLRLDASELAILPGATLRVQGSVIDDHTAPERVAVDVRSDVQGALGSASPASDGQLVLDIAGLALGDHQVIVTATDEQGVAAEAGVVVHVDRAPALEILRPMGETTVPAGSPVELELSVLDERSPAGDLVVRGSSDRDGPLFSLSPWVDGGLMVSVNLSPGEHRLTVSATDGFGLSSEVSIRVNVE